MDYENYYDKKRNGYMVHFPNNKGIDESKILEMFSAYGPVLSMYSNSDTYGLHFVIYENVQDAVECIKAFRNSKDIKILPHKHKIKKISNDNKCRQKKDVDNILVTSEYDDHSSSVISRSSLKHLLHLKQMTKMRFCSSISSEISDQSSRIMDTSFHEDEVLACIHNKERKLNLAQEVIVANIDPSTRISDILYLLENYHPICSSFIMQIPNTEIRFCRTYFATSAEALSVEKKFDKYSLHGKILIVLKPETMTREALSM
ncbi:uncharacterized protein LOC117218067 [Megalopta genalis]|uniref:uncharacterized protein LOC117218067 n=1 Tax=Megalopta genalis TaxID=115081 RepID=UPI003FD404B8